jgi:hypothetical protein
MGKRIWRKKRKMMYKKCAISIVSEKHLSLRKFLFYSDLGRVVTVRTDIKTLSVTSKTPKNIVIYIYSDRCDRDIYRERKGEYSFILIFTIFHPSFLPSLPYIPLTHCHICHRHFKSLSNKNLRW